MENSTYINLREFLSIGGQLKNADAIFTKSSIGLRNKIICGLFEKQIDDNLIEISNATCNFPLSIDLAFVQVEVIPKLVYEKTVQELLESLKSMISLSSIIEDYNSSTVSKFDEARKVIEKFDKTK